jgi:hypothetical protein
VKDLVLVGFKPLNSPPAEKYDLVLHTQHVFGVQEVQVDPLLQYDIVQPPVIGFNTLTPVEYVPLGQFIHRRLAPTVNIAVPLVVLVPELGDMETEAPELGKRVFPKHVVFTGQDRQALNPTPDVYEPMLQTLQILVAADPEL